VSVTAGSARPARRLTRLAVAGLGVLAVAACSSSSDAKRSGSTGRTGPSSPSSGTTSSTASSSTTAAPAAPACTIDAATAALPAGTRATGIICAGGWAAGPDTNGRFDAAYLLRVDNGIWRTLTPTETELACGAGNAMNIPEGVLAQSPCTVS
jgi:hypothetical protein